MTKYIRVRNWERFQHYKQSDDDRAPAWIKAYTDVLRDDNYMELSTHRRGLLHGLWHLYAVKRRCLRHDTTMIARELNARVTKNDLKALADAGFIEVYSRPSLEKPSRKPRAEVEKEREVTRPNGLVQNGRARDLLWEALVEEVGSSPSTRSERGAWNSALKELREAEATPEGIHVKAQVYRRRWPEVSLTPTALAKHWGALESARREELTPEQRAERAMEETKRRAAAAAERIRNRESV